MDRSWTSSRELLHEHSPPARPRLCFSFFSLPLPHRPSLLPLTKRLSRSHLQDSATSRLSYLVLVSQSLSFPADRVTEQSSSSSRWIPPPPLRGPARSTAEPTPTQYPRSACPRLAKDDSRRPGVQRGRACVPMQGLLHLGRSAGRRSPCLLGQGHADGRGPFAGRARSYEAYEGRGSVGSLPPLRRKGAEPSRRVFAWVRQLVDEGGEPRMAAFLRNATAFKEGGLRSGVLLTFIISRFGGPTFVLPSSKVSSAPRLRSSGSLMNLQSRNCPDEIAARIMKFFEFVTEKKSEAVRVFSRRLCNRVGADPLATARCRSRPGRRSAREDDPSRSFPVRSGRLGHAQDRGTRSSCG